MNWNEIATQVILGIIGVLITGLGSLLTYIINKYVKNEKGKTIADSFKQLVMTNVQSTYQTYVEALKKEGKFDKEAQENALSRCVDNVKKTMPDAIKKWLGSNYQDITEVIKQMIESCIKESKDNGKN